jgi:hypothetical protein
MLYRRTNDVERLQKVIGDTERQFVDCLQQIKTLGKKDEQQRKELEDLRGAARSWWTWWIPQKKAKRACGLCWGDSAKPRRKCSNSCLRLQSHALAMPSRM